MTNDNNLNIVLGVTGSISAYKSYDVLRGLVKQGHQVVVILSQGALKFIKSETFKYLGAKDVLNPDDDFISSNWGAVPHITLTKWADRIVIAPASANTIARFAQGMCPDLISSIVLAKGETPLVLYPAMNMAMLENPITKQHFVTLQRLPNFYIHATDSGTLACGDEGFGKLVSVEEIINTFDLYATNTPSKKVLITTGATCAPLDSIRYLTNPSSGITGYYLAKQYLKMGHQVIVVAGDHSVTELNYLTNLPQMKLFWVKTADEMFQVCQAEISSTDIFISSAAVSDFSFKNVSSSKLKKEKIADHLDIVPGIDILKNLSMNKKSDQKFVGFAAETDDLILNMNKKYQNKKLDLIIGNQVNNGMLEKAAPKGFGTLENEYFFLDQSENVQQKYCSKKELAREIYQRIN